MPAAAVENFAGYADQLLALYTRGLLDEPFIQEVRLKATRMKKKLPAEAHSLLGVIAFVQGNEPEVHDSFAKALAASGNILGIRANYASLLLLMGCADEAENQITLIMENPTVHPQDLPFLLHLCHLGNFGQLAKKIADMLRKASMAIPTLPMTERIEYTQKQKDALGERELVQDPFVDELFALAEQIESRQVEHVGA